MGNRLIVLGLLVDFFGVALLMYGEVRGNSALLRYWFRYEKANVLEYIEKQKTYKQIPLALAISYGPPDVGESQEYIAESFPIKFWGVFFLLIGFLFQIIGTIL